MVRQPGVCNRDPATTVLAHVRIIGVSGMGMKAPDWFGAWCCSSCHDWADGRTPAMTSFEGRRLALLEGMVRTQHEILASGACALTEAEVTR